MERQSQDEKKHIDTKKVVGLLLMVTHRAYKNRVLVYVFLHRKLVWRLYIILKK